MYKIANRRLLGYSGRFSLIHLITYSIVAALFLLVQDTLPLTHRVALEFYKPYRPFSSTVMLAEVIRGIILAFVLYPFYDRIMKGRHGRLALFGALWGLAIVGSLEPLPGSIEGLIYTKTTLVEHLLALSAGAVQVLLFSWLFICWEDRIAGGDCDD